MRSQLALAGPGHQGWLTPQHYDQVFTAHGTIMIFFMAMPFVTGLMNFAVPLQLGARDVAFPVLNQISFWLTAAGALLPNIALVLGEFARDRLARLSALERTRLQPRRWRRLLSLGAADCGGGHVAVRRQPRHHHPQETRARNVVVPDARVSAGQRSRPIC